MRTGNEGRLVLGSTAGLPGLREATYRESGQIDSGVQGRELPGPKAENMPKSRTILGTCATVSIKQRSKNA